MEEEDFSKLAVEDRCAHKSWKARVSGYEEAVKLFNQWDGDDANWKKYNGQIKKFITDANAVAQEKGLEAALAYVENCDTASKVVSDCIEGVVVKCVAAPKTKTKDLANQIVLMFCEIEVFEKVIEELIKGLAQKNPKVVSGCINNITSCLHAFGAKVIKVSPLLKAIIPLLDHRDKTVREEGKSLIVEAYRWVGDVMKQQLTGVKPVQMSELESEFEKVEGKPKAERLLRSQQQFGGGAVDDDGQGGEGQKDNDEDDDEPEYDPFEAMEAVEILEKLPKNFYELVEEKKWQLRKEALDALLPLAQSPKISPNGDFNELSRVLKKFIGKDTNVMLVTQAAQCLAGIAKGLRVNFKNGAMQCLPVVLEKFKEKKPTVVAALVDAADSLNLCLGIEAVQEDALACLKHKTPTVVAETAKFLGRSFAKVPPQLITNKKMVKGYVLALLECLSHADSNVREGSSEALGVLMKIIGEPQLSKLMPDLDQIKMAKVKEYCEKTVLTGKMPKITAASDGGGEAKKPAGAPKAIRGGGGKKPSSAAARPGAKKSTTRAPPAKVPSNDESDEDFSQPPAAAPVRKTSSAPASRGRGGSTAAAGRGRGVARPTTSTAASRKKSEDVDMGPPYNNTSNLKSQRFKDEQKLKILKWQFTQPRGEFVDQLKEQMTVANFNRTLFTQMFHADFKQHLKAIVTLSNYIDKDLEGLIANLDLILKWITLRFFETNPSVILKSLEYLNDVFAVLADDSYSMNDIEAVSFIPYLVNKVGDPKDQVRNSIRTMMKTLRQVYPVSKFCPYILEGIKSKNAKQRTECLDEVGSMIREYGVNVLQPSPAASMKEMAKQIADRDTKVRDAALNAITEAYFQAGEKMYKMVGNLPDRDMAMLEERIKRVSKSRPPPGSSSSNNGGPSAASMMPPPPEPVAAPSSSSHSGIPSSRPNSGVPKPLNSTFTPSPAGSGLAAMRRNFQQLQQQQDQPRGQSQFAPKNSPGREPRPISGAFTLDPDITEPSSMNGSIGVPRLIEHKDLDAIFDEEPVVLPQIRSRRPQNYPPSPLGRGVGNGSRGSVHSPPSSSDITENSNALEALDVILSQVFDKDASTCISALSQLDEFIKDEEKVVLLGIGKRMDQLLTACYMQYRHVLNNKMRMDNAASNAKEVTRLFQYLTMVLMSTYHHADLTKKASAEALHDLFQIIVSILLEPKVEQLSDGAQLLRALNVLTVKIIDRSDHTNISSAIIKLLSDVVANSTVNPKPAETVMKCLWKIIRLLPNWMDDESGSAPLDVDLILSDLHDFLRTYPPSYWKKQDSDTPLRTVKTVLHTMVKVRGDAILDHLTKINDPQNSELVAYLRKLLNSGIGKENTATEHIKNGNKPTSGIPGSNNLGSGGKIPRFTKSDHDALAEIFKKIGQQELTKQGLQELYNFKQQNPHADLEPFLNKSSSYFRNYIEHGLKSIEAETKNDGGHRGVLAESAVENNQGTNSGDSNQAPHLYYLDRLKKLRAQAGLDKGSVVASSTTSGIGSSNSNATSHYRISATSSTSAESYSSRSNYTVTASEADTESTSSTLTASSQQSGGNFDVDSIRERLERIRRNN